MSGRMSVPEEKVKSIGDHILAFQRAMTAEEVATLFGLNVNTIYTQARRGDIPSFRIGTAVRFDPKLLAEWYEKQSIG